MKTNCAQVMNRRWFLKLPALLPLRALGAATNLREHYFRYEGVIGTSLDLIVWTPSPNVARRACNTILEEIDALAGILNTRDPNSEISILEHSGGSHRVSPELAEVFDRYNYWERRSSGIFSIRPEGLDTPRNVDALGKAYIIDKAVAAARQVAPSIEALLLNIGGDIVVWGRSCEIAVANPADHYDNAHPITTIDIQNAAVATSGSYARGAHLKNARNGQPLKNAIAATVVAADAVTANALATTLCLTSTDFGLQLVESTPAAEALVIGSGVVQRTSGFARLERRYVGQNPATSNWPPGHQVTVTLPLTSGRSSKRPYVAVWVEDTSGKLVRMLAMWGTKSKYYPDLASLYNLIKIKRDVLKPVTRATRPAGKYELVWDGLDDDHKPVPLGTYRIVVETNQEHGTYAKQAGTITLGDSPTSITLPATTNFEAVSVQYGPK
jgi:thiamine biosynthesis lipoprotein